MKPRFLKTLLTLRARWGVGQLVLRRPTVPDEQLFDHLSSLATLTSDPTSQSCKNVRMPSQERRWSCIFQGLVLRVWGLVAFFMLIEIFPPCSSYAKSVVLRCSLLTASRSHPKRSVPLLRFSKGKNYLSMPWMLDLRQNLKMLSSSTFLLHPGQGLSTRHFFQRAVKTKVLPKH